MHRIIEDMRYARRYDSTNKRKLAEANFERSLLCSWLAEKLLSVCLSLPVFAEKIQYGGDGRHAIPKWKSMQVYSLVLTEVFVYQASLQTCDSLE